MGLVDRILSPRSDSRGSFGGWQWPDLSSFTFNGNSYFAGLNTSLGGREERIENSFEGYVLGAYKTGGAVAACMAARMRVFSQIRFQFQQMSNGRPGELFGTTDLQVLERPWPGAGTQDLLARMLQHADLAGNAYVARQGSRLRLLRPDWVTTLLTSDGDAVDAEVVSYLYQPPNKDPEWFDAGEVAHFAPLPDPSSPWRGMSWLTPVLRNISAHKAASEHKWRYFVNGATPNMVVKFDPLVAADAVKAFKALFEDEHRGVENAYKTLFLGGGADVTVVGQDFKQMDFKQVQGTDETIIAANAGVPAVIVGFSEGLQGSSLNTGNYDSAKRQFADTTIHDLASKASAALETIVPPPSRNSTRLWFDLRDIPFFRADAKAEAEVQFLQAQTMRQLTDGGFDPESVVKAVTAVDASLLKHSGKLSVQLQAIDGSDAPSDEPRGDDPAALATKVNAAGLLIRSGFKPDAALKAVGLSPIDHFGLLPVTLQSPDKVMEPDDPAAPAVELEGVGEESDGEESDDE